ncbi:MAG: SUMF1/EgtB/PvdO family nonheme iron enzyme, partial [Planctomycetota bacterium]
PGSYTYATRPNMADKPVGYVSYFDAMRFVNWLHNGQGDGDTETGAYTIGSGLDEVRSAGARFWLPSEDEWYKAAYHQPASDGGDSDGYWLYPTASNTAPAVAVANAVGDVDNPGTGVANHDAGADWNGLDGHLTTVGSAGPESASFYGTFDQAGNAWEWNEAVTGSIARSIRGGAFRLEAESLQSGFSANVRPAEEFDDVGFRVATVPEPSGATLVLAIVGLAGCKQRR